ncbi:MAG: cysteine peptidase family C39 domain-containing protein, partial [Candidatus Omnitrophota bacterium]
MINWRKKIWIKIIAFIIAGIFLLEQPAWAIEYNPAVLWKNIQPIFNSAFSGKPVNQINPALNITNQDLGNPEIADVLKKIILQLANKPIQEIRFNQNTNLILDKPLNLSKEKIEEIYNWVKGKPCGGKALYHYLHFIKGLNTYEGDVSALALTVDILAGVTKPEGNPEIIKNSLFALQKTAEFFGYTLYPVKINIDQPSEIDKLNTLIPFIAHFTSEHFVLVTKVTDEKVYFIEGEKETFLPKELFTENLSGYLLSSKKIESLKEIDAHAAKEIKGALEKISSTRYRDTSPILKSNLLDALLGMGLSAAFGAIGGWATGGSALIGMGVGIGAGQVGSAMTELAVVKWDFNPAGAQIFGMAVGGAFTGFATGAVTPEAVQAQWGKGATLPDGTISAGTTWVNANPILASTLTGTGMGALQGSVLVGLQTAFEDVGMNPWVNRALSSLLSMAVASAAFYGIRTAAMDIQGSLTQGQLNGEGSLLARGINPEVTNGYWNTLWKGMWTDNAAFQRMLIAQPLKTGIEYGFYKAGLYEEEWGLYLGALTSSMASAAGAGAFLHAVGGIPRPDMAPAWIEGKGFWETLGNSAIDGTLMGLLSAGDIALQVNYKSHPGLSALVYLGGMSALGGLMGAIAPQKENGPLWYDRLWQGALQGLGFGTVSLGLNIAANEGNFSQLQRESLLWLGNSLTYAGIASFYDVPQRFKDAGAMTLTNARTGEEVTTEVKDYNWFERFGQNLWASLKDTSINYITFGRTLPAESPLQLAMANQKIWDFAGLTEFALTARELQKLGLDNIQIANEIISHNIGAMFANYATGFFHDARINNMRWNMLERWNNVFYYQGAKFVPKDLKDVPDYLKVNTGRHSYNADLVGPNGALGVHDSRLHNRGLDGGFRETSGQAWEALVDAAPQDKTNSFSVGWDWGYNYTVGYFANLKDAKGREIIIISSPYQDIAAAGKWFLKTTAGEVTFIASRPMDWRGRLITDENKVYNIITSTGTQRQGNFVKERNGGIEFIADREITRDDIPKGPKRTRIDDEQGFAPKRFNAYFDNDGIILDDRAIPSLVDIDAARVIIERTAPVFIEQTYMTSGLSSGWVDYSLVGDLRKGKEENWVKLPASISIQSAKGSYDLLNKKFQDRREKRQILTPGDFIGDLQGVDSEAVDLISRGYGLIKTDYLTYNVGIRNPRGESLVLYNATYIPNPEGEKENHYQTFYLPEVNNGRIIIDERGQIQEATTAHLTPQY